MRLAYWCGSLTVLVLLLAIVVFSSSSQTNHSVIDVSWPNCSLRPSSKYAFGIIGVTGGLDFRQNPCLIKETAWFASYNLYMNTGYPGASYGRRYLHSPKQCNKTNTICLAYNWGFNAAKYALSYASRSNVHTFHWWLDVETVNSWTNNPAVNRASLAGAAAAIERLQIFSQVGFYAFPGQWNFLTNYWQNNHPAWQATGSANRTIAVSTCKEQSFTGGTVLYAQYTTRIDINVPCTSGSAINSM